MKDLRFCIEMKIDLFEDTQCVNANQGCNMISLQTEEAGNRLQQFFRNLVAPRPRGRRMFGASFGHDYYKIPPASDDIG